MPLKQNLTIECRCRFNPLVSVFTNPLIETFGSESNAQAIESVQTLSSKLDRDSESPVTLSQVEGVKLPVCVDVDTYSVKEESVAQEVDIEKQLLKKLLM